MARIPPAAAPFIPKVLKDDSNVSVDKRKLVAQVPSDSPRASSTVANDRPPVTVRMPDGREVTSAVDAWKAKQPPPPTSARTPQADVFIPNPAALVESPRTSPTQYPMDEAAMHKLATEPLIMGGPTGCVTTTLTNLDRLGIKNFSGGTTGDVNNTRGAMVQMVLAGTWQSFALPGSTETTIRSPYGTIKAHVLNADEYERMAKAGEIPSGSVLFQTRHGFQVDEGPHGNDMAIVRDRGRDLFSYFGPNPIIYGDAKEVVLLVPRKS
jgi:hypothetical protein